MDSIIGYTGCPVIIGISNIFCVIPLMIIQLFVGGVQTGTGGPYNGVARIIGSSGNCIFIGGRRGI